MANGEFLPRIVVTDLRDAESVTEALLERSVRMLQASRLCPCGTPECGFLQEAERCTELADKLVDGAVTKLAETLMNEIRSAETGGS